MILFPTSFEVIFSRLLSFDTECFRYFLFDLLDVLGLLEKEVLESLFLLLGVFEAELLEEEDELEAFVEVVELFLLLGHFVVGSGGDCVLGKEGLVVLDDGDAPGGEGRELVFLSLDDFIAGINAIG